MIDCATSMSKEMTMQTSVGLWVELIGAIARYRKGGS